LRDESTSAYTVVNGVAADSKPQLICIFLWTCFCDFYYGTNVLYLKILDRTLPEPAYKFFGSYEKDFNLIKPK
jgi:hypothetical protein